MTDTSESMHIKAFIKQILKSKGFSYEDLAQGIGVSLPTVRRYLTTTDMSIGTISKICRWLDIPFAQLIQASLVQRQAPTLLTEEQEDFFAANPHFYTYLRSLAAGHTPSEIQRDHGISPLSTEIYLTRLENLNIISRTSSGKIRLQISWPTNWRFPGALENKFGRLTHSKFLDHLMDKVRKSSKGRRKEWRKDYYFFLDSLRLRKSTYENFVRELVEVSDKYNEISRSEAKLYPLSETRTVNALYGVDHFDSLTAVMGDIQELTTSKS